MSETRGLHRKLAEVMTEAGRIPKNGKAPAAMGGFEFVQVGDAADAIRKALGERNVSMVPTAVEILSEVEHPTRSGGTMTTQTIRTTWTLTDGETGQTAQLQSLGTGADSGDKFSPKAQTNAMKYALLMGFLLSTGDDPELADTSDRQPRRRREPAAAIPEDRRHVDETTGEVHALVTIPGRVHMDADHQSRDGFLRRDPTRGPFRGFRLQTPEGVTPRNPIVEVVGPLAEAFEPAEGREVTVTGHTEPRSREKEPGGPIIRWTVLVAQRIVPTAPESRPDAELDRVADDLWPEAM